MTEKIISTNYADKVYIAGALAGMGARAVTMTAIAGTKADDSRIKFVQVNNGKSPSPGRTKRRHQWFLDKPAHRLHGALLLLMYEKFRKAKDGNHDAHALAITESYMWYQKLIFASGDKPLVSLEQFNLLAHYGFRLRWRDLSKGQASAFTVDNMRIKKCMHCRLPHLVEAHLNTYECQICG